MNRGELRAALKSRLGIPSTGDALLTDTELNNIIGYALRDVSSERDWPWLRSSSSVTFSTTTGLAAAPATMMKPLHLVIGGRRAKHVPLTEFLDAQAIGYLCVWTLNGTNLALNPVPSSVPTATLYFLLGEPTLAGDSSSPLLPDSHHQVLIARASYLANTRRSRKDDAQRDLAEYEDGVRRMWDASNVKSGPRTVRAAGTTLWARW